MRRRRGRLENGGILEGGGKIWRVRSEGVWAGGRREIEKKGWGEGGDGR
jgi:hypothetical protein